MRYQDDEFALLEWPITAPQRPPGGFSTALGQVLVLVIAGLSNAQIARQRGTSERTIANQVAELLRSFGAGSRHDLIARVLLEHTPRSSNSR